MASIGFKTGAAGKIFDKRRFENVEAAALKTKNSTSTVMYSQILKQHKRRRRRRPWKRAKKHNGNWLNRNHNFLADRGETGTSIVGERVLGSSSCCSDAKHHFLVQLDLGPKTWKLGGRHFERHARLEWLGNVAKEWNVELDMSGSWDFGHRWRGWTRRNKFAHCRWRRQTMRRGRKSNSFKDFFSFTFRVFF